MALTKERKEELVAKYRELLEQSRGVIFTEYRGLSNRDLSAVRRKVREANGAYHVAKMTLFKRALEEAGYPVPDELAGKPIAIGFCLQDIPGVAKALSEYAKDVELFSIRGGIADGRIITAEQVKAIADLPPLDVLRAQLIGLLDAPASSLVGVVQAGVAQVVNVLNAYVEDRGGSEAA